MADPEGRSSPAPRTRRGQRPAASLFDRLFNRPAAETGTDAGTGGAGSLEQVDIVDQAEAFGALRVSDVMTPRADVSALEIATPLGDVVRTFVEFEHSRMPIYRETLDDPVGVVHVRDLLKLIAPPPAGEGEGTSGVTPARTPDWGEPVLRRLRRELLYVPASMRAQDLLLRMRAARIHMALVIDEFGGTDGLVTLEDILEALVGEISDEHDLEAEPEMVERAGGLIECDARTPLEHLEQRLGGGPLAPEDEEEEIDTVAGLVAALAGRVPQRGEVIVHPDGHEFEVLDADPRRIRRLRVRPKAPASDGAASTPGEADRPLLGESGPAFLPGDASG